MALRLSPKHGVNPSVGLCFFCQKSKEVILAGYMKGDIAAPREAVWNDDPCDECVKCMEKGVIIISVDEDKTNDDNNPHRSGGWAVVSVDYIKRVFTDLMGEELTKSMLERRAGFLSDEVWDFLQLPRGPVEGIPSKVENLGT